MIEDEIEFRDLVAQTLESNGVLGKIKAELRASIFLALEDQDRFMSSRRSPKRQELRDYLQTAEGRQAFGLVRDLLEYFELEHTLAVLRPETGLTEDSAWRSLLTEPPAALPMAVRSKTSRPYLNACLAAVASAGGSANVSASAPALDAKSSGSNLSSGSQRQSRRQPQKQQQQVFGKLRFPNHRSPSSNTKANDAMSRRQQHHDDLLPMSISVARGSHASGNSNNNNSASLSSPTHKRPAQLSVFEQTSHRSTSGGGGGLGAADSLDPLSSPQQHSLSSEHSLSSSAAAGGSDLHQQRPRSRGNNFDDLPPLTGGRGGGGGRARQPPSGGDNTSNSLLSDQLANPTGASNANDDYFDDFEDSIAGGVSSSIGGGGGGPLASARSLKSQVSDAAGVEDEVIEIEEEELASAADEDPTDMTVDSEMSLQADYVEDAARPFGRSQL